MTQELDGVMISARLQSLVSFILQVQPCWVSAGPKGSILTNVKSEGLGSSPELESR